MILKGKSMDFKDNQWILLDFARKINRSLRKSIDLKDNHWISEKINGFSRKSRHFTENQWILKKIYES